MTVVLEHIVVPAHDREAAARFLTDVLGVEYLGLGSTGRAPGRGFYFSDPNDGHNFELLTHPA